MFKKILGLTLFCGLLFAGNVNPTILKTGDALPKIEIKQLSGMPYNTGEFTYPLVLSFFTTWCGACQKEIPNINNEYLKLKKEKKISASIVLINAGEPQTKVKNYLKKKKYELPVYLDSSLELSQFLGIGGVPTVLIFNRKGKLTYQGYNLPAHWLMLLE